MEQFFANVTAEEVEECLKEPTTKIIGDGGSATVYSAELRGVELAIKEIKFIRAAPQIQRCFERKAVIMGFHHPNVLETYGYVRTETAGYILTEYLDGQSLVQAYSSLDWTQIAASIKEIAMGLRFLHNLNLVHFDLNPKNIILTKEFKIKIIDFGSMSNPGEKPEFFNSRYAAPELTCTNSTDISRLGTGERFSSGADIFGLGLMILEMISKDKEDVTLAGYGVKSIDTGMIQGQNPSKEKLRQLMGIGLDCCSYRISDRPTLGRILSVVESVST